MATYMSRQDPDPDLAGSVTNSTPEYGSEKILIYPEHCYLLLESDTKLSK